MKLQISAILRDDSLSLTEKEIVVFSILNASLIKERREFSSSELLIKRPNQSLELKSPLKLLNLKDNESKGFLERLLAHHTLDSKGVFTQPETHKELNNFSSLHSYTSSSFRVKTESSESPLKLDTSQKGCIFSPEGL